MVHLNEIIKRDIPLKLNKTAVTVIKTLFDRHKILVVIVKTNMFTRFDSRRYVQAAKYLCAYLTAVVQNAIDDVNSKMYCLFRKNKMAVKKMFIAV